MNRHVVPQLTSVLLAMVLLTGCSRRDSASEAGGGPKPQSLPTRQIDVGPRTFTLMVADRDDTRSTGLMYRRSMGQNEGMIFVFPTEIPRSFWMKNVPIDLDILFLDRHGKVVTIKTMYAYDESPVLSEEPAMFAIELNAGTAKAAGLSVGLVVNIPDDLRKNAR